jgi:hypothetical protein
VALLMSSSRHWSRLLESFRPFIAICVAFVVCVSHALAIDPGNKQTRHFEDRVVPLLARHCLECHDATVKKARLDLSRHDTLLEGGRSGPAIVPGDPANSLLWDHVSHGEMPPEDRPPLSDEEKTWLRQWIEDGAVWTLDTIDPSMVTRDARVVEPWIQRLTIPEYIETVRSAVGVNIAEDARLLLPPDLRADGFSNTAYNLGIDLAHVEAYAALAAIIAEEMDIEAFAARFADCTELTGACMNRLIVEIGKWLLRGPLDDREVNTFLAIAVTAAGEGSDFTETVRYIIEAMLQSPRFIYRIEGQRGDGTPRPLDDYELASRLSYILWGGPPDEELMRAAGASELTGGAVEAQVRRMLDDPRVVEQSLRFIHEWMDLGRLDSLRPNPKRYPEWNARLAEDMREETLAFFREIVWEQERPLWDLLNAQVTYAPPRLAKHYGLEVGSEPHTVARLSEDDREAAGLQALYLFDAGGGNTVRDVSGAGEPLDLTIDDESAVAWIHGGLHIHNPALLATDGPPSRLIDAIRSTGEITLEVWITPENAIQSGPARILSLSSGTSQRNFTLGQSADQYEVRFRAAGTTDNGQPELTSGGNIVQTDQTYLVYTRDADGTGRLYVNGVEEGELEGPADLANWDDGFRLAIGNETSGDRSWRGTLHSAAIYNRALPAEVVRARAPRVERYDLAAIPERGGLLTQGSVLTIGGDDASMVTRGLFILHDFLFSSVGNAPPGVDTTPVPTKPGLSQRDASEIRLADPSCTACHSRFEPFAFAFERFDGIGAYAEVDEHGNPLRQDGEILIPGFDAPASFENVAELLDLLAESDRVRMNITRKVTQFALGRPLTDGDTPALEVIHREAMRGGGTYRSLITAIVLSDLVQNAWTERDS